MVRRKLNVKSAVAIVQNYSGESVFNLCMSIVFMVLVAAALFYVLGSADFLTSKQRVSATVLLSFLQIAAIGVFAGVVTGRLPPK